MLDRQGVMYFDGALAQQNSASMRIELMTSELQTHSLNPCAVTPPNSYLSINSDAFDEDN